MEGENSQPLHKQLSSHVKDKEFYYNARSHLPKPDELCTTCKPDVVCLVESLLCSDK